MPNVCSCHVLRILAVDVCRIWDVCCLPAPAHQPFSSNRLDLSAPEEAYSRNVRATGTLKFGYEGVLKIILICLEHNCSEFSRQCYSTFQKFEDIIFKRIFKTIKWREKFVAHATMLNLTTFVEFDKAAECLVSGAERVTLTITKVKIHNYFFLGFFRYTY